MRNMTHRLMVFTILVGAASGFVLIHKSVTTRHCRNAVATFEGCKADSRCHITSEDYQKYARCALK
jgi:hypothetical protein